MTGWTEVRRSTPAEHVEGVPDDALDDRTWLAGERAVTVYESEAERAFYVVVFDGGAVVERERAGSPRKAAELLAGFRAEYSP